MYRCHNTDCDHERVFAIFHHHHYCFTREIIETLLSVNDGNFNEEILRAAYEVVNQI